MLQTVCSFVILFCFSVYGICLLMLADRTPWKVISCILGILYALAVRILNRQNLKAYIHVTERYKQIHSADPPPKAGGDRHKFR